MFDYHLNQNIKQYVQFNPNNNEHRKIAATFLKTQSWKHTNVRFIVERPFVDVVTCITTKLAKYYAEKEFKEQTLTN